LEQKSLRPIIWRGKQLYLLDQTRLPFVEEYICCDSPGKVIECIKTMVVRGAPAIGIAAAYALAIAAIEAVENQFDRAKLTDYLNKVSAELINARPTAVNLGWAVEKINSISAANTKADTKRLAEIIEKAATAIMDEDVSNNRKIGELGAELVPMKASILTHCNAGSLATGGFGTALGVIRAAADKGKDIHVIIDETRPLLQGARLTTYEMLAESIPATLITDSCAGYLMSLDKIDMVIVGADRIALNGDTANKIGTFSLAVLAGYHDIPFFVAAPTSTIDIHCATGNIIAIEERSEKEITTIAGTPLTPDDYPAFNPAFDITPASLITAIITEKEIIHEPDADKIKALFNI